MQKLDRNTLDTILKTNNVSETNYIKVGMSACGLAAGADEVYKTLSEEIEKRHLQVKLSKCGCLGMCFAEPMIEVKVDGLPSALYGRVTGEIALKIIERHVINRTLVNDSIFQIKTS